MKRKLIIAGLCLVPLLSAGWIWLAARQQRKKPAVAGPAQTTDATGRTVAAAQAFLATLDDAGRAKVSFDFNSEQKRRWSNFPPGIYPRHGLRMGDLSTAQRDAVFNLLANALSQRGLQKVKEIVEGDEVLKRSESGGGGDGPMSRAAYAR